MPAEFQLTPGTEAPAEMNFLFPTYAALCGAENVTHNLHNVVTLRGALVRDARMWSNYLNEAIMLFGARTDVLFASIIGRGGGASARSPCWRSSATSTATSTTRPCGC